MKWKIDTYETISTLIDELINRKESHLPIIKKTNTLFIKCGDLLIFSIVYHFISVGSI